MADKNKSIKIPSAKPRITPATRRRINLRTELWPDVEDQDLWNRATFTGFTTIPRTLSIIIRIIDNLDKRNAGGVYMDLWCRSFDDYLIEIKDEYESAYLSGYSGQRAVRTWRERVAVLEEHGFIKTHKAPHGAYRYILIMEPHHIIKELKDDGKVDSESWNFLTSTLINIGHNTDFIS